MHASSALLSDLEFGLRLVRQDGCALKYLAEPLRNCRQVVFAALAQNYLAFRYASDEIKALEDVQQAALKSAARHGDSAKAREVDEAKKQPSPWYTTRAPPQTTAM